MVFLLRNVVQLVTVNNMKELTIQGKTITIYPASSPGAPRVWLNVYDGRGLDVHERLKELVAPDHTLIAVGGIDYDNDLSPWPAPAVFRGQEDFAGRADSYLKLLTERIMPQVSEEMLAESGVRSAFDALAGYSMGGLFALYAMMKTGVFTRFVSASGSLWYPGFLEKLAETELPSRPGAVYLSLGGKEAKTNNPVMSQVETRTRAVRDLLAERGVPVTLEMNPGNHFREPDLRTAKGISWILEH